MPAPLAIAAVAASVVSTGASMFGSSKAAKAQKKAARSQARLTYAQRMEEIRRGQLENALTESLAVGSVYASGVQMSGSTQKYIQNLREEHNRQEAWAKQQARLERRTILDGGQSPGQTASMVGQAASGIASAIGTYKAVS